MESKVWAVWAALASMVLAGCSNTVGAAEGDCAARLSLRGTVYRFAGAVMVPEPGELLGKATFTDCEYTLLDQQAPGRVFAVPGMDAHLTVLVRTENGDSMFVKAGLRQRHWPRLLRYASRYPTCDRPIRFRGTWDVVDPEVMPDEGDYHAAPPYYGTFTARAGAGLDFDRWARIDLRVRITDKTQPVPDPSFLRRALNDNPVVVWAACRGRHFEATSVRLVRYTRPPKARPPAP